MNERSDWKPGEVEDVTASAADSADVRRVTRRDWFLVSAFSSIPGYQ